VALSLALALCFAALATVTVATGTSASAAAKRLSVSPKTYVGGQILRWSGNIGQRGVRPLTLQLNMGRPGDQWNDVDGFRSKTRADGSFAFSYPAPSMFNVLYRVKSGKFYSPVKNFQAKSQDLTIAVTGSENYFGNNMNEPAFLNAGRTFGITVDTTPDDIFRSPDSKDLPVFEGRTLTLQRRVDGYTWQTLARTSVNSRGFGYFSGLTEDNGVAVYRVRQENYFTNGNKIGWLPSFPLYIYVGRDAQNAYDDKMDDYTPSRDAQPNGVSATGGHRAGITAAQTRGWTPALWDFTWEFGQSLDSPPDRGAQRKGRWIEYTDGAGRVSKYNGGLTLNSSRYYGPAAGDFGTTRATMQGNATTQGRWEARMRIRAAAEKGGNAYQVLAELVPERASDYDCGAHNILIASISPWSKRVDFGAQSPKTRWKGTTYASAVPFNASSYGVAVELTKKHITWFLNGNPVGSVTSKAAFPGVPMTLRFSLVGDGDKEMDQISLISDWQRGFSLAKGKNTISPKRLSSVAAPVTCD
jgi:hypothetical protein